MKKVLAIAGSPRKGKNTDILLDYLIDGMKVREYKINKIYLKDKTINPCTGCEYCGINEGCANNDDMNFIYEQIDNSDIIVLAAPIYFNSVNGITKNMIDRCQRYWSLKYSLGQQYKRNEERIGVFLSTGGAIFDNYQFSGAIPVIDYFFRAINAKYKGNYFISNTDKEPTESRIDIKTELFDIGKNIWNRKNFYLHR